MVQVKVNEGILEGEEVQNEYGGMYYSFRGIPYAQPPVGDLRFKEAQPLQPWTGVRKAIKFGPICFQYDRWKVNRAGPDEPMSEDCLFLNVYTPDIKPKKLQPVIVVIHGGANTGGSGNDDFFGPQYLIRHGVLLVSFNYRLEVLGFLCLNTADIPGNLGMKDQVAAFRWLRKNIANFGGDPDNITLLGGSTGGVCVSYHLISPMTKGLFRRAVIQSGAATCWMGGEFGLRDRALLLAKQLGCYSEDDKTLYEFFKNQPVEKLINLELKIWKSEKLYDYQFPVVSELDFGQERYFYGDITDAFRRGAHEGVETIVGYTKDEGLVALNIGPNLKGLMYEANHFNEFFVPGWMKTHCVLKDQLEVGSKMKRYYFKDGEIIEDRDRLMKFISTDLLVYATILSVKFLARRNKVYCYKLTCLTERNVFSRFDLPEPIIDDSLVCHGDELGYIFPLEGFTEKVDKNSETFEAINRVTTLWTNFAKYGNPTPTPDETLGVEWKPYTLQNEECLIIGNKLYMSTLPDTEEIQFWENLFREYLPKYAP